MLTPFTYFFPSKYEKTSSSLVEIVCVQPPVVFWLNVVGGFSEVFMLINMGVL